MVVRGSPVPNVSHDPFARISVKEPCLMMVLRTVRSMACLRATPAPQKLGKRNSRNERMGNKFHAPETHAHPACLLCSKMLGGKVFPNRAHFFKAHA